MFVGGKGGSVKATCLVEIEESQSGQHGSAAWIGTAQPGESDNGSGVEARLRHAVDGVIKDKRGEPAGGLEGVVVQARLSKAARGSTASQ